MSVAPCSRLARRQGFALAMLWGLAGGLLLAGTAHAHPLAPALLELTQADNGQWSVLWRFSRLQKAQQAPEPVLPDTCEPVEPVDWVPGPGSAVSARWSVRCGGNGLVGGDIRIERLQGSPINVIVRLRDRNDGVHQTLLDAAKPGFTVPGLASQPGVWQRYLTLGAEHLVFGPDHLLFLLALVLLVGGLRRLAWTLTAFTLGHSITLAAAALNLVRVNPAWMEIGIALSLVVVARELLAGSPSWLGRWPAVMALVFGLLHGLGFAGALADIGLPSDAVVWALLAFNLGIEFGQFAVVALVWPLLHFLRTRPGPAVFATGASAYVIGGFAVLWCFERVGVVAVGPIL